MMQHRFTFPFGNKRTQKNGLTWLAALLVCAACDSEPPVSAAAPEMGMVIAIRDGDTIVVELDGSPSPVRYIGINTAEHGRPCYREATDANARLVRGQNVRLTRDPDGPNRDAYGRLMRYVWRDDLFINAEMVRTGLATAHAMTSSFPERLYRSQLVAIDHASPDRCTIYRYSSIWPDGRSLPFPSA
ncbi:MAG: hypothetical protein CL607_23720 [Anaerolineaceae bacterium]|nr:hypothetical protein [Anaerolineaceae bacterium]